MPVDAVPFGFDFSVNFRSLAYIFASDGGARTVTFRSFVTLVETDWDFNVS